MTTIRFQELKAKATQRGNCSICGKRTARSATFTQTVSPFNKTTDGRPKTRAEVWQAVQAEAEAWSPRPSIFDHDACSAEAVSDQ